MKQRLIKTMSLGFLIICMLGISKMKCDDSEEVTFESMKPGGTINKVMNLDAFGSKDCTYESPMLSYTYGPDGPTASVFITTVTYYGKLTNGNDFGKCKILIKGTYPECNTDYFRWERYGTITISKPAITLKPQTISIDTFSTCTYYATITPSCKYTIKISNPDGSLKVSPESQCTIHKNTLELEIKDVIGIKRTSSVILTIASNCDSSKVTDSLNIVVM